LTTDWSEKRDIDMDTTIKEAARRLEALDHRLFYFILLILVTVLGFLDYVTGFEYSFSLFYLFPIALAAWFISRRSALVFSILCAAAWYLSNTLAGQAYSQAYIGYWNATIRLGFFVIASLLLAGIKTLYLKAEELSRTDMNTGLMNSRSFFQLATAELQRARRYKRPFTVAYLDIDNFKQINDTLGHMAGDLVLSTVADTMRTRLRSTDLIARMGGDEFAAFLPETEYSAGSLVISKLQAALLKAMDRHHWDVTFSIGAVSYYKFDFQFKDILQKADKLMYTAKEEGKNTIRFDTVE
jgi:diguanylate cyclase (GGDEF)-like protein